MDDVFDEDDVQMVSSSTRKFVFGCGNIYLTIDELRSRPLRSFLRRGHSGLCTQALMEAIGRLVTIVIQRTDLNLDHVWKSLSGIACESGAIGRSSCVDALAREMKKRYPAVSQEEAEPCAPTD